MSDIYQQQKAAFEQLDELLTRCYKDKADLDINNTIYEFCKNYPISSLALKKQIIRFAEARDLKIDKDKIVMKQ